MTTEQYPKIVLPHLKQTVDETKNKLNLAEGNYVKAAEKISTLEREKGELMGKLNETTRHFTNDLFPSLQEEN